MTNTDGISLSLNPCKECIVKMMCKEPCDDLVIFVIKTTDSTKIKMDFLEYCEWKAEVLRVDIPELINE